MGLLDSICRICMQQDLLLNSVQAKDEKVSLIYDIIFKSAREQTVQFKVCRLCEQELRRSYRFFSLCSQTYDELSNLCEKDGAACVEPQNQGKVEVASGQFDLADNDEETLYDFDYSSSDTSSIDGTKDEVDFENLHSKIDKLVDLTVERDVHEKCAEIKFGSQDNSAKGTNKNDVLSDAEKSNLNVEKCESSKGVVQFDEDIKIEISDHELEIVKEEPPTFVDSDESNDTESIQSVLVSLPKIVIPRIKCFPCSLCKKAFLKDSARMQHILQDHHGAVTSSEKTRYKCDICDKTFSMRGYLNQHKKFHTGQNLLECYDCGKKFTNKSMLVIHTRKHLKVKEFECDRCKLRFNHWQSIRKHQLNVCGQKKVVQCKLCSKVIQKRALTSHMKLHERPAFYDCKICDRSFNHKYKLKNHIKTHTGEKAAQCEICKTEFSHKYTLIAHMRIHRGERPFKCDLCDSAFTLSGNLQRHMKVHSDVRQYKCDVCNQAYKEQANLDRHKLGHTGIRPYQCKICEKTYITMTDLKQHTRTHTGEKPFECNICNRKFASREYLKNHLRRHTNPSDMFTCSICNKKIKFQTNFHRHMKRHRGELTYTCDICGQNLSSRCYLNEHRKLHFSIKAFQCQCGEHFILKKKVRLHLQQYPDHKLVKGSLKRIRNKHAKLRDFCE